MIDYFSWHLAQCRLMKAWPRVAKAIADLRKATISIGLLRFEAGETLDAWDCRLGPVYVLLSDIQRETGCWYKDTFQ